MNPVDQSRRRRFGPIGGRGRLLLSAVALMGLAGCESGFGSKSANDPFNGFHAPPPPTPVSAPGDVPGQAAATTDRVPPLPSSYTAAGSAAVAGGETATPESARILRIPSDTNSPVGQLAGGAARGAAPSVTVGSPEPATPGTTAHLVPMSGGSPQTTGATTQVIGPAATVRTFEEAQQFLKLHNVNWQRLDMEDDGRWKFECSAPNPRNASMNTTYRTNRPFPDPLSAIRAVIVQIEQRPH